MLSRKQMQLFLYWVRWTHGLSAPFSYKEAVIPLEIHIMLQILIGTFLI